MDDQGVNSAKEKEPQFLGKDGLGLNNLKDLDFQSQRNDPEEPVFMTAQSQIREQWLKAARNRFNQLKGKDDMEIRLEEDFENRFKDREESEDKLAQDTKSRIRELWLKSARDGNNQLRGKDDTEFNMARDFEGRFMDLEDPEFKMAQETKRRLIDYWFSIVMNRNEDDLGNTV
jgi:cytochrome c551/c552